MTNQVVCADCIEFMAKMADGCVQLTLTDIPYGVINRESGGIRVFDKGKADVETFSLDDFIEHVARVTQGSIYIFCSSEQISPIRKKMIELGLTTRLCVWEKTNPSPVNGQHFWLSSIESCVFGRKKGAVFNEFCKSPVWRYPVQRKKYHNTEKSLALFDYLVKVSSNENDIVFDPCVGSGTTAIAAKNNNRQFIALDISQDFVDLATKRLNGQTPSVNT